MTGIKVVQEKRHLDSLVWDIRKYKKIEKKHLLIIKKGLCFIVAKGIKLTTSCHCNKIVVRILKNIKLYRMIKFYSTNMGKDELNRSFLFVPFFSCFFSSFFLVSLFYVRTKVLCFC